MSTAGNRRARFAVRSVVLLAAITVICVLCGFLASRFAYRLDATATREHQLSERTRKVLNGLQGPHELVVLVNGAGLDLTAARRTQDVLDSFGRASPSLRVTTIDASSTKGIAEIDQLLARLSERFASESERTRRGVEASGTGLTGIAESLGQLSDSLLSAGKLVDPEATGGTTLQKFFTDAAAICRVSGQDLSKAGTTARQQLSAMIGQTRIPATDEAVRTLRQPMNGVLTQLKAIAESLEALSAPNAQNVSAAVQDSSRRLLPQTNAIRDELRRQSAAMDDLPKLPIASVARLIEHSSAALVIGPSGSATGSSQGIAGVDVSSLFPARAASGEAAPDVRARTEDLLAGAIASISTRNAPIIVLTHGTASKLGPDYPMFSRLVERLRLRGVDVVEWPVAVEPEMPSMTKVNPAGERPLVFVMLPATADSQETAARMLKLSAAVKKLINDGKSLLISLNPSATQSVGAPDPLAEFLTPLGITAKTGLPLLQQFTTPTGRVVSADLTIIDPHDGHAISSSIRGLGTVLLWPIPLMLNTSGSSRVMPIISVENQSSSIWGESEWSEFRRVPPAQRSSLVNPPAPDASRDDPRGPWTVAACVERPVSSTSPTQRIVVVGSNGWFFDEVAAATGTVNNRPTLLAPGNAELFEASVFWLAHEDERLAAGPQAGTASLIPPLSEGRLSAIRWALIAGLPLIILILGAVWRLVRG